MRAAARDRGPASGLVWILIPLRSPFGDGNWIRARRDSERLALRERERLFAGGKSIATHQHFCGIRA
jgi:hypothetical protein